MFTSLENAKATARILQRTGYNVARLAYEYEHWVIYLSPGRGESFREPKPWYKYQPSALLLAA